MEIKFHTRPTQINRQNPIVVKDGGLSKVYAYPIKGDFYVKFVIAGGVAFAGLVKTNQIPNAYNLDVLTHTVYDIHTKNDLVNYVVGYRNTPINIIESICNIQQ